MANEGMVRRVEIDHNRFRQIVRGRIKKDLHRFITQGEFLTRKGRDVVSVPLPQIRLPQFRFGRSESGVGMGEGDPGTPLEGDAGSSGGGPGGDQAGEHVLEVEVSLDDLAKILGEELELPRIEPRGTRRFSAVRDRYTGLRRAGPESLRHFKRTFKESLKRQMIQGTYDPAQPRIMPIRDDRRYRSWNMRLNPESNAVIIYMMDVSGSMGSEQKEIVRIEAFWIDTWLRSQYRNLEVRYIVHDAVAKEVDQHTFYHLRESGGTKISSAYELCTKVIEERYPPSEWNIYPFHFSDGDNWSGKDTEKCVRLLEAELLPRVNMFGYGQVKSAYGTGQFKGDLDEHFKADERLVTSDIQSRESILDSIREFLGKGR